MKLIVFGSTGTVGRHLVEQALQQGHDVTAFSRKPESLDISHGKLTLAKGDALDANDVASAVQGHDAVLVTLGAGRNGNIRAKGTINILRGMEQHGIRRLVCQTTLGIGKSIHNLNFFWRYLMFGMLLRPAYMDHVVQETAIEESDVDWVIIRPGAFTDGPATGSYKHGFSPFEPSLELKVSRADVAGFMLRQLVDNTYLRRTPALSY